MRRLALIILASLFSVAGASDFWAPPVIEPLPDDLSEIPAPKLVSLDREYQVMLKQLRQKASAVPDARTQYPGLQHEYDRARLKMADLLPDIIKRYGIDGSLKDTLTRFSENFNGFRQHMRDPREPEYQDYDRHVSMSFVSMGVFLSQNPPVETRFKTEMNTPDTPLGGYSDEVDAAFAKLDRVKTAVKADDMARDLEARLKRIDAELTHKRKNPGI